MPYYINKMIKKNTLLPLFNAGTPFYSSLCGCLQLFKCSQFLKILIFLQGGAAEFFKNKPNFFTNYRLQLHGEQLSLLHSQLLTRFLYHMSPYMVYTRIIGSHQIGNYLAGYVPPNRKLFGGTCPAK